jgi:hypothetical protein
VSSVRSRPVLGFAARPLKVFWRASLFEPALALRTGRYREARLRQVDARSRGPRGSKDDLHCYRWNFITLRFQG